jgi:predicted nucleic acid-binding protein
VLNLDTHILVDALEGELAARERRVLEGEQWGICAIVLWELARFGIDLDDSEVVARLADVYVWRLDLDVARISTRLDFRGDPADELIAATSIVHAVPLVTRDRKILRSKLVPFAL